MIRAIDMVICFPKGFNGRIITCVSVFAGGSVSREVLNDDDGAMLATSGDIKIKNYRRATYRQYALFGGWEPGVDWSMVADRVSGCET
jgi:hypothetical protein